MLTPLIDALSGVPAQLAVVLLGILPLAELRAAIPVGILAYRLPVAEVYVLAQIGSIMPVLVVYGLCDWWVKMVERRKGWLHRITDKVLRRAEAKMHGNRTKWGFLALALFVAVPLPGTGAWTGALGAYLLRIPFKTALPAVFLGNLIAGAVVTAAVLSGSAAFSAIRQS